MVFFPLQVYRKKIQVLWNKNQTAARDAANDLNPSHLGLIRPCVLEEEKNCSEKEVAKIKHLTPDIDVLNARNMITLTSSRTGNSRRNRYIYSTRECAFLFLLHKPRITKRKNAFKDKKRKEKKNKHARTDGNSAGFLKRKENTILNVTTTRNRKWNSMSHTKCENGTWKAYNTCGRATTRSASCCCC